MKVFTKSLSVLLLIFCVSGNLAFAANELFRSIANGNWNSTSTWEMSTNGGSLWFAATSTPTNLSSTITINNTVTVTENVTADQIILSGGSDLVDSRCLRSLSMDNCVGSLIVLLFGSFQRIVESGWE